MYPVNEGTWSDGFDPVNASSNPGSGGIEAGSDVGARIKSLRDDGSAWEIGMATIDIHLPHDHGATCGLPFLFRIVVCRVLLFALAEDGSSRGLKSI